MQITIWENFPKSYLIRAVFCDCRKNFVKNSQNFVTPCTNGQTSQHLQAQIATYQTFYRLAL